MGFTLNNLGRRLLTFPAFPVLLLVQGRGDQALGRVPPPLQVTQIPGRRAATGGARPLLRRVQLRTAVAGRG